MSPGLTMDREGYRAMQDGTEASLFTLSGASKNPPPRVSSEQPVATGKGTLGKTEALVEATAPPVAKGSNNPNTRRNALCGTALH